MSQLGLVNCSSADSCEYDRIAPRGYEDLLDRTKMLELLAAVSGPCCSSTLNEIGGMVGVSEADSPCPRGSSDDTSVTRTTVAQCTDRDYCFNHGEALLPSHQDFPEDHTTACYCMCLSGYMKPRCEFEGVEQRVRAGGSSLEASTVLPAATLSLVVAIFV
jgi:hypothetical protein